MDAEPEPEGSPRPSVEFWDRPAAVRVIFVVGGTAFESLVVFLFLRGRSVPIASVWVATLVFAVLMLVLAGAYALGVPIGQPARAPTPSQGRLARHLGIFVLIGLVGLFLYVVWASGAGH